MTGRVWQHPSLWKGCVGAWSPSRQRWPCSTLIDYSPNNNHGTLTNMGLDDWVVSGGKHALDFDGTNDYLLLANTEALNLPVAISISAWITVTGSGTRTIISKRESNLTPYMLRIDSAGTLGFYFSDSLSAFSAFVSSATVPTNKLVHVAVRHVFGVAASTVLYIAGMPVTATWSGGGGAAIPGVGAGPVTIGTNRVTPASSEFFSGRINEVSVWNRALLGPEAATLARRVGIEYETAPRRSYMAAVAGGITGPLIGGKLSRQTSLIGGRLVQ